MRVFIGKGSSGALRGARRVLGRFRNCGKDWSFVSRQKALRETGLAPGTLDRLVKEKKVRAQRLGREALISRADLERVVGFAAKPAEPEAIDSDVAAAFKRLRA